mmetsp:Transcript_5639/g.16590  ORF Transcript_5639/g.16590 Transcript_5639/m.16590 type:complete len:256 (-) Transcript_5639:39-806(-)
MASLRLWCLCSASSSTVVPMLARASMDETPDSTSTHWYRSRRTPERKKLNGSATSSVDPPARGEASRSRACATEGEGSLVSTASCRRRASSNSCTCGAVLPSSSSPDPGTDGSAALRALSSRPCSWSSSRSLAASRPPGDATPRPAEPLEGPTAEDAKGEAFSSPPPRVTMSVLSAARQVRYASNSRSKLLGVLARSRCSSVFTWCRSSKILSVWPWKDWSSRGTTSPVAPCETMGWLPAARSSPRGHRARRLVR